MSLKKGTSENCRRVFELLQPFWQFLSRNGGAYWAEEANSDWEDANLHIGPPKYILGYYGTDRCDSFDLGDLRDLCTEDEPPTYLGDLYALTFDELDIECRTSPYPVTGSYYEHRLRRLWHEHFRYSSREKVLTDLGSIANMTISSWAAELRSLLEVDRAVQEETWT